MTPLALELLEDLYDRRGILIHPDDMPYSDSYIVRFLDTALRESKFFEITAISPLSGELGRAMYEEYEDHDRVDQRRAYLPAPLTWIECEHPSLRELAVTEEDRLRLINGCILFDVEDLKRTHTYRTAFVFRGRDSTSVAERYQIGYETPRQPDQRRIWHLTRFPALPLVHSGLKPARSYEHFNSSGESRHFDKPVASQADFAHYAQLALINSPRIIGQRGHYPHERTEREALKKLQLIGKFPLRAWTEIVLQVTPNPKDVSGETPAEKHLTGERCLHYCRTYLRVRCGMLEYVEGHWRGNPALGIKQSRYRVKPEQTAGG
jgi:hypothetical protein